MGSFRCIRRGSRSDDLAFVTGLGNGLPRLQQRYRGLVRREASIVGWAILVSIGCGGVAPKAETVELHVAPRAATSTSVRDVASPTDEPAPCGAQGCLPGTEIPDSSQNRAVMALVWRYRDALRTKDIATLVSLASPEYLDGSGTPDGADDVDRASLQAFLEHEFAKSHVESYDLRCHSVIRRSATIEVSCTYVAVYLVDGMSEPRRVVDEELLVLEEHHGELSIVSGM